MGVWTVVGVRAETGYGAGVVEAAGLRVEVGAEAEAGAGASVAERTDPGVLVRAGAESTGLGAKAGAGVAAEATGLGVAAQVEIDIEVCRRFITFYFQRLGPGSFNINSVGSSSTALPWD